MARNQELMDVVLAQMAAHLKERSLIKLNLEGDEESTKSLIKTVGKTRIDKEHKIRYHLHNFIGYGYDFKKTDEEGVSAQRIYERAIENSKKLSGLPNFETLVAKGIEENRFGWYITRL